MMIFAPMAAMMIQMAISRSREFAADAGAARITGNPDALADALRKIDAIAKRVPLDANPATAHMFIVKPFSGQGLMSLFSTHPPTEARVQALLQGAVLSDRRSTCGWSAHPAGGDAPPPASGQSTTYRPSQPVFSANYRGLLNRCGFGLPLAATRNQVA